MQTTRFVFQLEPSIFRETPLAYHTAHWLSRHMSLVRHSLAQPGALVCILN